MSAVAPIALATLPAGPPMLAAFERTALAVGTGAVLALLALTIAALGVRLARSGRWVAPLLLCVAAASVGFVGVLVVLTGVGAVDCPAVRGGCAL